MLDHALRQLVDNLVFWKFLPSPVLGFVASDLVFWMTAMAVAVVIGELRTEPRIITYRWLRRAAVTFAVSTSLFLVAHAAIYSPPAWRNELGAVYQAGSSASNSFPSHHALLAALAVSWVALVCPRRAIPFMTAAVICGWALVLYQSHYIIDVVVSWFLVGVGAGVAVTLTRELGGPLFLLRTRRLEARRHTAEGCSVQRKLLDRIAVGNQKLLDAKRRVRDLKR